MCSKTTNCTDESVESFEPAARVGQVQFVSPETDLFAYMRTRPQESVTRLKGRYKVGLISQLGMYEQLPLWTSFFEYLGFEVVLSESSSFNPASDVLNDAAFKVSCFPQSLIKEHLDSLFCRGVDFIFMPCESFGLDESYSVNRQVCSVVAYYSEILKVADDRLTDDNFVMPYLDLNTRDSTAKKMYNALKRYGVKKRTVKKALDKGYAELVKYSQELRSRTDEILTRIEKEGKRAILLACRPCHFSAVIDRGINKRLSSLGFAVLSVDCVPTAGDDLYGLMGQNYCARFYGAAEFVCKHNNINLVQIVSCGCDFDEVTASEVRAILEKNGKPYFQIILDESDGLETLLQSMAREVGFCYEELSIKDERN